MNNILAKIQEQIDMDDIIHSKTMSERDTEEQTKYFFNMRAYRLGFGQYIKFNSCVLQYLQGYEIEDIKVNFELEGVSLGIFEDEVLVFCLTNNLCYSLPRGMIIIPLNRFNIELAKTIRQSHIISCKYDM